LTYILLSRNKKNKIIMRYRAKENFRSLTGKEFKKGDIVPNGDATKMLKHLVEVDEDYNYIDPVSPGENKVMTTKDLKTK